MQRHKCIDIFIKLGGIASENETWTLNIDFDGLNTGAPDVVVPYMVGADNRALSKIVRAWAEQLDGDEVTIATVTYQFHAEAQVDIVGNAKLRLCVVNKATQQKVAFKLDRAIGASGS